MEKITLLSFFIGLTAFAQQIEVTGTSSIVIGSNASLNMSGLELSPSANYTIANNTITYSATPVVAGNTSINRVYNVSPGLTGYMGDIKLYYDAATELNGITETDLVLEVFDGTWNNYPTTVDTGTETLVSTFSTSIDFSSITASSSGATLPVDEFELGQLAIYPNPATSTITITSNIDLQFEVYNSLGQKMIESKSNNIDISTLSNGMYILKVIAIESNKSNTYKIIKK